MTTGNKLSKLRKEAGYTQEQVAEMLNVSRQSISKWESDTAYPETEKLIELGKLYGCSMDYLLKDEIEEKDGTNGSLRPSLSVKDLHFEWKSKKSIAGLPLCHINVGLGRSAKGVVAIGLAARGILALGLLSLGIISFGVFSLGLLAIGAFALGGFAAGAIALGIMAFGGVCVGIIAAGGVAVGAFCAGGVAVGKYLAVGDYAFGDVALGITKMVAREIGFAPFHGEHLEKAAAYLDKIVPWYLCWAKEIVKLFMC